MINIVTVGMNHETARVEIRECLARDPENVSRALSAMRENPAFREGLYLSTCNRVEVLYTTDNVDEARNSILEVFSELGGIRPEVLASSLYTLMDIESIRHIFKVASSLDSMVVGEPQVLGQIKEAYFQSTRAKTSGVILNRLMHRAFHVAKRVRTETGISDAAVSISYAAVELAKKIFHQLEGRKVLLVGAGEMAELAARHLLSHGVSEVFVANRTFDRAVQAARVFHGRPVYFEEIESQLIQVDIVITSTASPDYVVTHEQVKRSLRKRKNRPLFFIDIAVPRDVEPHVNSLGNAYVYDIDDLKGVVEVNRAQRREEAVKAERIVEEEVLRFEAWLKTLGVVPTIISLKEKVEEIRRAELRRSLSGLGDLNEHQKQALELLTTSIAEKIIHDPILTLKQKAHRPSRDRILDFTRRLFRLDDNHDL